jgi:hypothetical protein
MQAPEHHREDRATSHGFLDPVTQKIVEFLRAIGVQVAPTATEEDMVLPGIRIANGSLLIDEERLLWPGDLLHEAAHLALAPTNRRAALSGDTGNDGGEELGSLAWSWAALVHLGLDPEVVFHRGNIRRTRRKERCDHCVA